MPDKPSTQIAELLAEMDDLRLENHKLRDEVSDLRMRVKLGYYHDVNKWRQL